MNLQDKEFPHWKAGIPAGVPYSCWHSKVPEGYRLEVYLARNTIERASLMGARVAEFANFEFKETPMLLEQMGFTVQPRWTHASKDGIKHGLSEPIDVKHDTPEYEVSW